jgi:hypothetical protein
MQTDTKKKTNAIRAIYNDDCAVIDFLADLIDRKPLTQLQNFINWSNQGPHCILANCPIDNVVVLILYKADIELNDPQNKLILFIHEDIAVLCKYFKNWCDNTSKDNKVLSKALNDILRLLYIEWAKNQDPNTDVSFLG